MLDTGTLEEPLFDRVLRVASSISIIPKSLCVDDRESGIGKATGGSTVRAKTAPWAKKKGTIVAGESELNVLGGLTGGARYVCASCPTPWSIFASPPSLSD